MATTPISAPRIRRTKRGQTVADYLDRHNVKAVAVYLPPELHAALLEISAGTKETLQSMFTLACSTYYGGPHDLPPLAAPTRSKTTPQVCTTWYCDIDLHRRMKIVAMDIGSSVSQLFTSAIVATYKDAPSVKRLKIKTGYPAYQRAPDELPDPGRKG